MLLPIQDSVCPRCGRCSPLPQGIASRTACTADGVRRSRRPGDEGLARAGAGDRRRQRRQGRRQQGIRRAPAREAGARRQPHAVRHRLDHQGDDRGARRHARRREEARLGRSGGQAPAVVSAEGSLVTRELTVRDLLTHRGGLGNADYLWYGQSNSTDEILERVRLIAPAYSLRS